MKRNLSKPIYKFLLVICMVGFASHANLQAVPNYTEDVESSDDSRLTALSTEIHPSIYLNKGELKSYGDAPAELLFTDAASIDLLYQANEAYSNVELITLRINDPKDGKAMLDLAKLSSFSSLKYVRLIIGYDICGDNSSQCLEEKAKQIIINSPADNASVQLLYAVVIPQ